MGFSPLNNNDLMSVNTLTSSPYDQFIYNWLQDTIKDSDLESQHGLQNVQQVISFLKSPDGEKTRNLILTEVNKIIEQKDNLVKQITAEQIAQLQLLAYMLKRLAESDEQFRRFLESIQTQIDKTLSENKKPAKVIGTTENVLAKLEDLKVLEKEISILINKLSTHQNQLAQLTQQLTTLRINNQAVQQQFQTTNTTMNNLVNAAQTLNISHAPSRTNFLNMVNSTTTQLNTMRSTMSTVNESLNEEDTLDFSYFDKMDSELSKAKSIVLNYEDKKNNNDTTEEVDKATEDEIKETMQNTSQLYLLLNQLYNLKFNTAEQKIVDKAAQEKALIQQIRRTLAPKLKQAQQKLKELEAEKSTNTSSVHIKQDLQDLKQQYNLLKEFEELQNDDEAENLSSKRR
ncbi:hypothetical protein ACNVED_06735 [Legionella sp. D16C41]|uniref:hypothetical protein n=1 Tax=Legionella sp. D16C41 TaxID=3402688 RepID=UPI003AF78DD7